MNELRRCWSWRGAWCGIDRAAAQAPHAPATATNNVDCWIVFNLKWSAETEFNIYTTWWKVKDESNYLVDGRHARGDARAPLDLAAARGARARTRSRAAALLIVSIAAEAIRAVGLVIDIAFDEGVLAERAGIVAGIVDHGFLRVVAVVLLLKLVFLLLHLLEEVKERFHRCTDPAWRF